MSIENKITNSANIPANTLDNNRSSSAPLDKSRAIPCPYDGIKEAAAAEKESSSPSNKRFIEIVEDSESPAITDLEKDHPTNESTPSSSAASSCRDANHNLLIHMSQYSVDDLTPRLASKRESTMKGNGKVVVIDIGSYATSAFHILVTENILSAPVVTPKGRYVGFIELLDFVDFMISNYNGWKAAPTAPLSLWNYVAGTPSYQEIAMDSKRWTEFWSSREFKTSTVRDLIQNRSWARKAVFRPLYPGFSLISAIEIMARCRVHRVPILSPEDSVVGLVTESMVISLIDQKMSEFGSLQDIPVPKLVERLSGTIITINEKASTLEAFKMMLINNMSGLPVVDDNGELVDVISTRDLRAVGSFGNECELLWYPIDQFKKECRNRYPDLTPDKPIYVTKEHKLDCVLRCMDDGNIHRVIVAKIDDQNRVIPTHVITQRDVLSFILLQMGFVHPTSAC